MNLAQHNTQLVIEHIQLHSTQVLWLKQICNTCDVTLDDALEYALYTTAKLTDNIVESACFAMADFATKHNISLN